MDFSEKIILDGQSIRKTKEGFLVADVRGARTGIQVYGGSEVGKPELEKVNVYRPPEEVFAKDSLASWAHKPVSYGHPSDLITADSWNGIGKGVLDGAVARDGETVRVSMMVMDAATIKNIEDGVRELSAGYTCDLDWTPGTTPEGLKFDAKQTNIRVNHLAIVPAARGGHKLRIGDDKPMTLKTIIVDGLAVEVTDAAELAIQKLQRNLADAAATIATRTTERDAAVTASQTKDGEIAALKVKLDEAKLSPAQLDALVTERSSVVADAKKFLGDRYDGAGKTIDAIRREALKPKFAAIDDAAVYPEVTVKSLFETLAKDAKPATAGGAPTDRDPVREIVADRQPVMTADAAREERDRALSSAYRNGPAATEQRQAQH